MHKFLQKNRNHVGILASVYLTALVYKHFYTKQLQQQLEILSKEHTEQRMESFSAGYEDAKRMYNRHPHLYCETCVKAISKS